jgi:hypothetical protein
MTPQTPKLAEIAAWLDAHLKRFEADPKVNVQHPSGVTPFYEACAWASGRWVGIRYVGYQSNWNLTKPQALAYLEWLDAGGVGKHFGHTGESK